MSFGMFEANVTSENEEKIQVREAANKLAAATYDVRERFGQFLFAARDLAEYNDRLALSKNDILKTIEPHVFPRTGTVRRVLKPLEQEFKSRQLRTAMRRQADWGLDSSKVPSGPQADALDGSPSDSPTPPNRKVPMPPSGGVSTTLPAGMSMAEAVNLGDEGARARGERPQNSAPAYQGPLRTPASTMQSPAAASAAPSASNAGTGANAGTSSGSQAGGGGDSIGPGKYTIQSGDTYSDLAQRAGWGDDYQGFANATGYQADNPDMIYAGDTIDVKAPGSSSSSAATSSTDAAAPPASPPLAAEAGGTSNALSPGLSTGGSGDGGYSLPPGESNTQTGLTNPTREGTLRAARRRRADFERNLDTDVTYSPSDDELKPEGDFKGWLDSVDQDAEGKVDRDFGGTFPGGTDHDEDPAKTDFVKDSTRRFARWCQANRVRPSLAALDHYAPSDREYVAIASRLQRVAETPGGPAPQGGGVGLPDPVNPMFNDTDVHEIIPALESGRDMSDWAAAGPKDIVGKRYLAACRQAGIRPTQAGFRRFVAAGNKPVGPEWTSKGKPKNLNAKPDLGTYDDKPTRNLPGGTPKSTLPGQGNMMNARRRTAAPDYLQKADEALTNLLNQKAEEFQQTIAPLQQALQTVQQAEQEAQAANPMNVLPPAGTVNVLPDASGGAAGGAGGAAGGAGGGMDPNALAGLMGGAGGDPSGGMGGDPSGMGGDPSMGGGMPPGLDPNALQMQARRRRANGVVPPDHIEPHRRMQYIRENGGTPDDVQRERERQGLNKRESGRRGKGRGGASPRTAKNVEQLWDEFTHQTTLRGGQPDVETFVQRYKVGPKARKRIEQKAMGG